MADAPITYLGPAQDDAFELPRWQDNSAAAQNYYDYAQQASSSAARAQQHYGPHSAPPPPLSQSQQQRYPGGGYDGGSGTLARAGSMDSTAPSIRSQRSLASNHAGDDIEKAYHSPPSSQPMHAMANPFYPPSVSYSATQQPAPPQQQQQQLAPQQPGASAEYFSSPGRRSYDSLAPQQLPSAPTTPAGYPHSHLAQPYVPKAASPMLDPSTPNVAAHLAQQVSAPPSPYQPMAGIEQRQRRSPGFKRVRDPRDLRPFVSQQPAGRRLDPHGTNTFLSPLRALTSHITTTYHICNPDFHYETAHNPRRVLTKPSKPVHNDGYDNEDWDYILYVNDWLGPDDSDKNRYLILDVLGQGTFGQVVKCQNIKTHEIVAVKVVKNKPAYYNQSMMEVTILDMLNKQWDAGDEHHILRMRDHFVHKNHLCLVFELLSSNLYELIKQNSFQGLSTQLVKVFTAQLLDALCVLKDARLIHCDLKPENILLRSLQSPQIKVIDFGSACHERQTVFTYIQSRFYRSPEVLLGCSYNCSIDMWSLGCIAVELFLGLPLFPGTSEYNQINRIVEMLGNPPAHMIERGKQAANYFDAAGLDENGRSVFKLKSIEQYSREHNQQEQPGKKYFQYTYLPDIVKNAPMPPARSNSARRQEEVDKEMNNRMAFIDFCQGLLHLDPMKRWTPGQAKLHPFITGEKFIKPYQQQLLEQQMAPVQQPIAQAAVPQMIPNPATSKHVYGGLVPMNHQKPGTRAYTDAASYNQHLAQHQSYTAQQAQAAQASSAYRNPYITPGEYQQGQPAPSQQQQSPPQQQQYAPQGYSSGAPPPPNNVNVNARPQQLVHQGSNGNLRSAAGYVSAPQQQQQQSAQAPPPQVLGGVQAPANAYYPAGAASSRNRSNTLGTGPSGAPQAQLGPAPMTAPNQMDVVPPALARLNQMGALEIPGGGGRNALTPVMNRDEGLREWERRGGAGAKPTAYPPALEYLSQQAEMTPASWVHHQQQQQHHHHHRPYQPSGLHNAYHSNASPGTGGGTSQQQADRDAVMGSVRAAAGLGGVGVGVGVAPPAVAYGAGNGSGGGGGGGGGRYDPGPQTLYVPQQASGAPYAGQPTSPARSQQYYVQQPGGSQQPLQQQQQRNPFQPGVVQQQQQQQQNKRASQMDWPVTGR